MSLLIAHTWTFWILQRFQYRTRNSVIYEYFDWVQGESKILKPVHHRGTYRSNDTVTLQLSFTD